MIKKYRFWMLVLLLFSLTAGELHAGWSAWKRLDNTSIYFSENREHYYGDTDIHRIKFYNGYGEKVHLSYRFPPVDNYWALHPMASGETYSLIGIQNPLPKKGQSISVEIEVEFPDRSSGGSGGGSGSTGGGGGDLAISGTVSFQTSGSSVNIGVSRVSNTQSGGTSGSLRLRLWASDSSYSGGSLSGYVMGTRSLGQLSGGYSYTNISGNVSYTRPPDGRYHIVLTLEEYTSNGWRIKDYANFSETIKWGSIRPRTAPTLNGPSGYITSTRKPSFSWNSVSTATYYKIHINRNGSHYTTYWTQNTTWTPSVDLPGGNYEWWIAAWNEDGLGPWSNSKKFSIPSNAPTSAPVLLSPSGTLVGNRMPTFQWSSVSKAQWYLLWIERAGGGITKEWNSTTSWKPSTNLAFGSYTWYVAAWNEDGYGPWSSGKSITISPDLPPVPTPVAPFSSTYLQSGATPTFSWTTSTKSSNYQVFLKKTGTSVVIWNQWVGNVSSAKPPATLTAGDYEWWVRAWNNDGYSDWSPTARFTVSLVHPSAPAIMSSENSTSYTLGSSNPNLRWRSANGAVWYQVYVQKDGQFFKQEWVLASFATNYTIELASGNYEWWVRSWNPDSTSQWSKGVNFTVQGEVPPKVTTTAPTHGAFISRFSNSTTTLRWQQAQYATWYHVWVNRDGGKIVDTWIQGESMTSYLLSLNSTGSYEFWVQAYNRQGTGAWSNSRRFTVY